LLKNPDQARGGAPAGGTQQTEDIKQVLEEHKKQNKDLKELVKRLQKENGHGGKSFQEREKEKWDTKVS
jgi:molybdenum-dependent DNA-binding transcriptional regulator ModE